MVTRQTNRIKVSSHDVDFNQIMNTTALLAHLQDAATDEFDNYGPSIDDLRADGKAFVVSRIGLKQYAPINYGEEVTIHTWACPGKGVEFLRFHRVEKDGIIVAEMESVWALIDINTRKFYRHSDIEAGFGTESPIDGDFSLRFSVPDFFDEDLIGVRRIYYSDIDRNGHMNNANYANMLCDLLTARHSTEREKLSADEDGSSPMLSVDGNICPEFYESMISEFSVSFSSEARLGEEIKIFSKREDDLYFFKTEHSDGKIGITARMKLVPLSE